MMLTWMVSCTLNNRVVLCDDITDDYIEVTLQPELMNSIALKPATTEYLKLDQIGQTPDKLLTTGSAECEMRGSIVAKQV